MSPRDPFAVGHEPDAARFRWIVYGIAILAATVVASLLSVRAILSFLTHRPRAVDAPRSVVDRVAPTRDGPPLQPSLGHDTSPTRDLVTMRANEDRVFGALGWTVADDTGLPRVPASIVAEVAARRAATRPSTRPATREATR